MDHIHTGSLTTATPTRKGTLDEDLPAPIRRRVVRAHNKPHQYQLRCKSYEKPQSLGRHIRERHNGRDGITEYTRFECDFCGASFLRPNGVKIHIREKHAVEGSAQVGERDTASTRSRGTKDAHCTPRDAVGSCRFSTSKLSASLLDPNSHRPSMSTNQMPRCYTSMPGDADAFCHDKSGDVITSPRGANFADTSLVLGDNQPSSQASSILDMLQPSSLSLRNAPSGTEEQPYGSKDN